MKIKICGVFAGAAVLFFSLQARATMSNSSRLIMRPEASLHWHTSLGGAYPVLWSWPDGAQSARLTVTGKSGASVRLFARPVSSCALSVPASAAAEDVVNLRLEFLSGEEGTGDVLPDETLTAEAIGLVRGVGGATADLRAVAVDSRQWTRVRAKSAVLPIPEGTESLTLNDVPQAVAAVPGWHLWSPVAAGPAVWTLETLDGIWGATLTGGVPGFMLLFR